MQKVFSANPAPPFNGSELSHRFKMFHMMDISYFRQSLLSEDRSCLVNFNCCHEDMKGTVISASDFQHGIAHSVACLTADPGIPSWNCSSAS